MLNGLSHGGGLLRQNATHIAPRRPLKVIVRQLQVDSHGNVGRVAQPRRNNVNRVPLVMSNRQGAFAAKRSSCFRAHSSETESTVSRTGQLFETRQETREAARMVGGMNCC